MEKTLDDLLMLYRNTFNENFPIMAMKGMNENDAKILVKDCIESGRPYVTEYKDNTDY